MALFLVVTVLMISIAVVTVIAFQVAQNRNESTVRDANWALDSTLNTAAESVGTSGMNLTGVPLTAPATWTKSVDNISATRWWALPLDAADSVPATAPAPFVFTASNGSSVIGITVSNLVYTSPDGQSWTRLGASPVPAASISQVLVGLGSYIIVAAPNTDNGSSVVYTSRNGGTWTGASGAPTPSSTSTETIARMACSSTDCVLITTAGRTATRYWTSTNAKTWTLSTSTTAGGGPAIADDVTYAAHRFVTVGYDTRNETSFSTDAVTWSDAVAIPGSDSSWKLNRITAVNDTFVAAAVGTNNPAFPNITAGAGPTEANKTIVTSADGLTWTARPLPVVAHWTDLVSNGTTLIAVAEDPSTTGITLGSGTPIYVESTTGTTWSTRSLPSAGNWASATPLGTGWLFTAPTSTTTYLVSSTPGQPARANKLLVVAEVKTSTVSDASVYQSVLAFNWDPTAHRWGVAGAYASLNFALNAAFTTTPGNAQALLTSSGATFTFADTSAGTPTKWAWDFGDGTTAKTQNPTKTYTTSGTYTVTLVVTEAGGVTSTVSHTVAVQAAPSAPRHVSAAPGVNAVALTWGTPTDDGAAAISDYTIQYRTHATTGSPAGTWTTVAHPASPNLTVNVNQDLDPANDYDFRVAAINAVDQGPWSPIITSSPLSTPSAPQSVAVTGQLDLNVTWAAPARNGGSPVTVYHLDYATTANFSDESTIDTTNTYQPITGLTENTHYYIRVRALNIVGTSPASATLEVTTKARPDAPTSVNAAPSGKDVSVTWTAPTSNGGAPITHYTAQYSTNADFTSSSAAQSDGATGPITFTGAPDTTYYIRVTATNTIGTSSPSDTVTVLTNGLVSALPQLTATPGVRSALLTWTAPTLAQAGRTPVTGYTLTWTAPNGTKNTATLPASATSVLIDAEDTTGDGTSDGPLASATAYTFTLNATNAVGANPFTTTATTFAAPAAPGTPALTVASTTSLTATWTAPTATGGSPVTDYVVQTSTDNTNWSTFADGVSTATTATITGLTPATIHYVRVAAVNLAGTGTSSGAAFTLLPTAPGAPTSVTVAVASASSVTATWTAPDPANGSPTTSYRVSYSTTPDFSSAVTTIDTGTTSTSKTLTGLTAGTTYYIKVAATNGVGTGTFSTATAVTVA